LPTELDALGLAGKPDALLAHMSKDKKVRDGRITLILPRRIGEVVITQEVPEATIVDFLRGRIAA
jgi:3-dehydroquinate synthetase